MHVVEVTRSEPAELLILKITAENSQLDRLGVMLKIRRPVGFDHATKHGRLGFHCQNCGQNPAKGFDTGHRWHRLARARVPVSKAPHSAASKTTALNRSGCADAVALRNRLSLSSHHPSEN